MHALCAVDEALFCELFSDRETMQFIGPPLSRDEALRSFRAALRATSAIPPRHIFMRVLEKTSGEPIGVCSIQNLDVVARRAELGLMIRPAHRARGLGKEALSALVGYAFRLLPIEEAFVQYQRGHLAAERLVISAGFSPSAPVTAEQSVAQKRTWSVLREFWNR